MIGNVYLKKPTLHKPLHQVHSRTRVFNRKTTPWIFQFLSWNTAWNVEWRKEKKTKKKKITQTKKPTIINSNTNLSKSEIHNTHHIFSSFKSKHLAHECSSSDLEHIQLGCSSHLTNLIIALFKSTKAWRSQKRLSETYTLPRSLIFFSPLKKKKSPPFPVLIWNKAKIISQIITRDVRIHLPE